MFNNPLPDYNRKAGIIHLSKRAVIYATASFHHLTEYFFETFEAMKLTHKLNHNKTTLTVVSKMTK